MLIARWQFTAKFGRKDEAIRLIKEWNEQIGMQTNIDVSKERMTTGSVGTSEGLVETEFEIGVGELLRGKLVADIRIRHGVGKRADLLC